MVLINLVVLVSFILRIFVSINYKIKEYIFHFVASRFGNVGTLHLITNSSDIDWLLNEGMADPYIVALTPKMFNK